MKDDIWLRLDYEGSITDQSQVNIKKMGYGSV